ncbi:MAG: cation:proton antiporter [Gemmatimonadetes bacterium]|nr:cation:proton antiporter [Gemmatimonadota bacterium]
MHELTLLRDLVILVAVAIPVVAVAQRLRVPSVVGFLVTGVAIGPHSLGFIQDAASVSGLAELGLILLLFTIGLELSVSRIIRLGRLVLQGGAVQVAATIATTAGVALIVAVTPQQAVFYGALVALSSTAIVLKIYTDRGELDSSHGRVAMAILLFQDISVVPLMLLVPVLAGAGEGIGASARHVGISLAVVATLIVVGRAAVPWVLQKVVLLRNRELFTLSIVFFALGAAYVTASTGLSLALGAFIAGLVIAESEYGVQALSDVLPFRDTFTGIFFISVGMLLDLGFVLEHAGLVLTITVGVFFGKAIIAGGAVRLLKRSWQVSVLSGLGLAQVGEFSFILAMVGAPLGLLDADGYQLFLAMSVITMLATPFVISAAGPIADWFCRVTGQPALEILPHEEQAIAQLHDHVIIVGYGLNGRNLARTLRAAGISYVILEANGQTVLRARTAREPIYFGDGSRREVLERVGIERARAVVLAISSPAEERRGVAIARQLSPSVRIVVRTRYVAAMEELQELGANEVVPEEFETSLEIFARVLRLYGVPRNVIEREVQTVRDEHYEMFRRLQLPDLQLDALKHFDVHTALETIEVEEGARAIGENPTSLNLREETGATVIAVIRDGVALYTPDPEARFRPGDTVVLIGDREALRRGAQVFRAAA